MKTTKKYSIFIDTKLDTTQNPSNFNVRLNNWFVRNKIKMNDGANDNWYLSVKTFSMFNSFSNITTGINDTIVLYVEKSGGASDLLSDLTNANEYNSIQIILEQGNPNVLDIQTKLNSILNTYDLECVYQDYNSKFLIRCKELSTDLRKRYFLFKNTYDLLGFEKDKLYKLDNNAIATKSFISEKPVNLMADRLIKLSFGSNSDIRLKDMNYCNHLDIFNECNMFYLQPVNVPSYELIYYEKSTENLIPIELLGNSIRNIELLARNQDGHIIEGLSNYIMVLELIHIKEYDYVKKIHDIVKQLYLWIAVFLKNRI